MDIASLFIIPPLNKWTRIIIIIWKLRTLNFELLYRMRQLKHHPAGQGVYEENTEWAVRF